MRTNPIIKVAMVALLATTSLSCQKDVAVSPTTVSPGRQISQNIQAHYSGFNWDDPGTTTMPVSARLGSPVVYVPWRSNGGLPLDPNIVDDYHRKDGWELAYCSFTPDDFPRAGDNGIVATATALPLGGLYFALYNRFRGLLRFYLYVPPGSYGFSTQLAHGLQVYSNSSATKMLNFEAADISDPAQSLSNGQGFTKTNKDGLATTGGWYAMQYQIAYDPAINGASYPNPGFRWDTYSVSISQINLNGTEIGNSRGIITTPAPDFDWSNVAINGGLALIEAFGSGGTGVLAAAAQGGLAGNTTGYLSGIFGGTSAGQQTVDLTMNANITTTGTANSSHLYQSNAMPFPSQQTAGTNGVPSLLNYPLGLFNLSGRPSIKAIVGPPHNRTTGGYDITYQVASGLEQNLLQLNPAIFSATASSGATYSNFKTEVILLNPEYTTLMAGQQETIGTRTVFTGTNTASVYSPGRRYVLSSAAVRVSFYVVPNDPGSPKQFIVKTFLADVTQ